MTWVSRQQGPTVDTACKSLGLGGCLEVLYPNGIPFCDQEAVCSLGGWTCVDQHRRPEDVAPLRSRAKEGVAPLVILSSPAVPAVCLSAGCASPLSFEPAPTPLAAAVLASFGLPLWALAGHREVGRPRRRSPYSIEPVSLGSSSPAALAIGLNHIEFRCNATSARCPVRMRTADLPIAPGGLYQHGCFGMTIASLAQESRFTRQLARLCMACLSVVGWTLDCRRPRMWGTRGELEWVWGSRGPDRPAGCRLW